MKTIKIKNRDGLIRTGSILAEHEDSKQRQWVTVLCENDDVETLPADNIVHYAPAKRWRMNRTLKLVVKNAKAGM